MRAYRSVAMGVCILSLGLAGCASIAPTAQIEKADAAPPPMILLPGDEVEVTFFGAPDLNVTQKIRRDGRISLKLIEPAEAAGKTTEQLEKDLIKRYESQLQIKAISVVVRNPATVLVTGSVLNPGRIEMSRPMTVLEAVMSSGGFDARTAEVRSVVVIRHEEGRRKGYVFDFKSALAGEGAEQSFFVRPYDIVYVPRTQIVKFGQVIDQYINALIPDLGIGYSSSGEVTFYR